MSQQNPNHIIQQLLICRILQPSNIIQLCNQIPQRQTHHILPQLQPQIPNLIQQTLLNIIKEKQFRVMYLLGVPIYF